MRIKMLGFWIIFLLLNYASHGKPPPTEVCKPVVYTIRNNTGFDSNNIKRFKPLELMIKKIMPKKQGCLRTKDHTFFLRYDGNVKSGLPAGPGMVHKGEKLTITPSLIDVEYVYKTKFYIVIEAYPFPMSNPPLLSEYHLENLLVKPEDMVLDLEGKDAVFEYQLEKGGFNLDGTKSRDPSYTEKEQEGKFAMTKNTITWKCVPDFTKPYRNGDLKWHVTDDYLEAGTTYICTLTVTRDKQTPFFPQTKSISRVISVLPREDPVFHLTCTPTCESADPTKPLTIEAKCTKHCDKDLKWTSKPPDLIDKAPKDTNGTRTFNENTFQFGDTAEISATFGKVTKNVKVNFRRPQPKLKLNCLKNCNPSDPRMDTEYQVTCESECHKISYDWSLEPKSKFTVDTPNSIITIPRLSYKDRDNVALSVKAWDTTQSVTISFAIPNPTIEIVCVEMTECSTLDPRDDVPFKVSCDNCDQLPFTWTVDPKPAKYNIAKNLNAAKDVITLVANIFKDGDSTTLTVNAGGRAIASKTVTFVELEPVISLTCVGDNCPPHYLQPAIFKAVCVSNCNHLRRNLWNVSPAPENWQSWQSPDATTLTIPAKTFKEGDSVSLTVTNGKIVKSENVQFQDLPPELIVTRINCKEDCDEYNPLFTTSFEVTCAKHCFDDKYSWRLSPEGEDFSWEHDVRLGKDNKTITLLPDSMQHGDEVIVTAYSKKGIGNKTVKFEEPIPELQIICTYNCENYSNPHARVNLTVTCLAKCTNLTYGWEIDGTIPQKQIARFTGDNTSIEIKPKSYEAGKNIFVSVRSRNGTTNMTLKFEEPEPELTISCDPPCDQLNPAKPIRITVTCDDPPKCENIPFKWELSDPKIQWDESVKMKMNRSFVIPPDTFKDGEKLNITALNGKGHTTLEVTFAEPPPVLNIICIENCFGSNPLNETVLSVKCVDVCDNVTTFSWTFDPDIPSWDYNVSTNIANETIRIKPNVFEDRKIVNITVKARNGNETKIFKFVEPKPKIVLKCVSNCRYNPYEAVVLKAHCPRCQREYKFDQRYQDENSSVPKPEKVPVAVSETYTIPANAFYDSYSLYVEVRNGKAFDSMTINFEAPLSNIEIVCEAGCIDDPETANPLFNTQLRVICKQSCEDVKYTWEFIPISPNKKVFSFNDTEHNATVEIPPSSYSDQYLVAVEVDSGRGSTRLELAFHEPTPKCGIQCQTDCTKVDPTEEFSLNMTCTKYCENASLSVLWDINPKPRNVTLGSTVKPAGEHNISFVISPYIYLSGENASVFLKVRKCKAEQSISFIKPPSRFKIVCLKEGNNCSEATVREDVALKVVCTHSCDNLNYIWNWKPEPYVGEMNITTTDVVNDTLTIMKDTYDEEEGLWVTITVESNGRIASFDVEYKDRPPFLDILCYDKDSFSTEHDPRGPVLISFNCIDHCQNQDEWAEWYQWYLDPEPITPNNEITLKNSTNFTIPAYTYESGQSVEIIYGSKKYNPLKNCDITFRIPPWSGYCGIEPHEGRSGFTEFFLECAEFDEGVLYRVYQAGVLIAFGTDKFIDGLLLAETDLFDSNELEVHIGWNWTTSKEIIPNVVTVTNLMVDDADVEKEVKRRIFGKEKDCLKELSKHDDLDRFVQMVAILHTAMRHIDEEAYNPLQDSLIEKTLQVVPFIEPIQSVSLLKKLSSTSTYLHKPYTLHLLMECLDLICKAMSDGEYPEDYKYIVINETVHIASYLLSEGKVKRNNALHRMDYRNVDILQHNRLHHTYLLRTITCLQDLLKREDNVTEFLTDQISLRVYSNYELDDKLTVRETASYIEISRNTLDQFDTEPSKLTYYLADIESNLFWWDPDVSGVTTNFIQFRMNVDGEYKRRIEDPITIYFNRTEKEWNRFSELVKETTILRFSVPNNAMLSVIFEITDNDYKAIVSPFATFDDYSAEFNESSKITDQAVKTVWAEQNYIFVAIQPVDSSATFTINYIAYSCMMWDSDNWEWQTSNCKPSETQIEGFISCECNKFSIFSARDFVPKHTVEKSLVPPDEDLSPNIFIAIATGIVLALTLICMICAWCCDRRMRRFTRKLLDTIPGGKQMYQIFIVTGAMPGSGTKSRIGFQLDGAANDGDVHTIRGELFTRNSHNCFSFFETKYLGRLRSIKIWLCNPDQEWFCDYVVVQDLTTPRFFRFDVNECFSLDRRISEIGLCGVFILSKDHADFGERLRSRIKSSFHVFSLMTNHPRYGGNLETVATFFASLLLIMATVTIFMVNGVTNIFVIAISVAIIEVVFSFIVDYLFRNTLVPKPEEKRPRR